MPTELVVRPDQEWGPVAIEFNVAKASQELGNKLPFTCWLEISTNITLHKVAVHVIEWLLKVDKIGKVLPYFY